MRILLIDNCSDFRRTTGSLLRKMGHQCLAQNSTATALKKLPHEDFDALFIELPGAVSWADGLDLVQRLLSKENAMLVVVMSALGSIDAAIEALQAGATDYLEKPLVHESLERCLTRLEAGPFVRHERNPPQTRSQKLPVTTFETQVPCVRTVYDLAARVAPMSTTLLLLGESGTGKTTLARAIHSHSGAREGPFVTVNCPSLSRELFESDLFGHVCGAFTGAIRDKIGKVTHAAGGTLFLDEIGDLSPDIQSKLLRLIQEREYERVGDPTPLLARIRVIAATNKNLEAEVQAGRFREDLFYRLSVIPIEMPPLRDRIADLPWLAEKKLEALAREIGKPVRGFSSSALDALSRYTWPGNLRELHSAIEHALIMTRGDQIERAHFPHHLRTDESPPGRYQVGSLVSLETLERAQIEHILAITTSQEEAATILGIDPTTLYRKRKRYSAKQAPIAAMA